MEDKWSITLGALLPRAGLRAARGLREYIQDLLTIDDMRNRGFTAAILAIAVAASAPNCFAQAGAADSTSTPHSSLFRRRDLAVAAGFVVGTLALLPLDEQIAVELHETAANERLKNVSSTFRFFGGPAPLLIGTGTFLVGRATRKPVLADVSLHTVEAVLLGGATTSALKMIAGRERPYASADTNPHVFKFFQGKGTQDFTSFPSGHTTIAFTTASALVAETRRNWPQHARLVALLSYGVATGVGLSRMYDDKHWASDVVAGAAIGTFAGLKTVRFNHMHTKNRLDRLLLGGASLAVLPKNGVFLSWSLNALR